MNGKFRDPVIVYGGVTYTNGNDLYDFLKKGELAENYDIEGDRSPKGTHISNTAADQFFDNLGNVEHRSEMRLYQRICFYSDRHDFLECLYLFVTMDPWVEIVKEFYSYAYEYEHYYNNSEIRWMVDSNTEIIFGRDLKEKNSLELYVEILKIIYLIIIEIDKTFSPVFNEHTPQEFIDFFGNDNRIRNLDSSLFGETLEIYNTETSSIKDREPFLFSVVDFFVRSALSREIIGHENSAIDLLRFKKFKEFAKKSEHDIAIAFKIYSISELSRNDYDNMMFELFEQRKFRAMELATTYIFASYGDAYRHASKDNVWRRLLPHLKKCT
jgi:hypothetical protein